MIPAAWALTWTNADGSAGRAVYHERAKARGAAIMRKAQGCTNVRLHAVFD